MLPTLRRVAGAENVRLGPLTGTAEDFSFFQQKVPGLFFFLGVTPKDQDPTKVAAEPFAAVLRRRIGAAGRREGDDEPRAGLFVWRQVDETAEANVAHAADVIDLRELIDHASEALIEHRHLIALERDVDRRAV